MNEKPSSAEEPSADDRCRELEARLAVLEAELQDRDSERDRWLQFFYATTHDLKAPVSAVINYLRTILRKGSDDLDERLVKMVHRSIIRLDGMLDLISDLLELARLESGTLDENFDLVDWEELLVSCTELANELAALKDIRVTLQVRRPLPSTCGSEIRLNQLLMNLVTNAVNYTRRGGRVSIRAFREDDSLVVQVEDNGIGIAPEHLLHLFDEFYRADPETSPGTGLGLSIAKRIAELHRGDLSVESPILEDGSGSRFSLVLPLGLPETSCGETPTDQKRLRRLLHAWKDPSRRRRPGRVGGPEPPLRRRRVLDSNGRQRRRGA